MVDGHPQVYLYCAVSGCCSLLDFRHYVCRTLPSLCTLTESGTRVGRYAWIALHLQALRACSILEREYRSAPLGLV